MAIKGEANYKEGQNVTVRRDKSLGLEHIQQDKEHKSD